DRESDKEAEHQQVFGMGLEPGTQQISVVEGPVTCLLEVNEYQAKNCDQHDQAAGLGVDEELGRCVDPCLAFAAAVDPQGNQEVHRYQQHLPEEEEQEQVNGEEYANHAAENPHQVEVEEAHPVLDFIPRAEYR